MNKTYLVHHGIKGQRWGVRRYQNEDGSLTPLGKKKYDVNEDGTVNVKSKFRRNENVKGVLKTALGATIATKSAAKAIKQINDKRKNPNQKISTMSIMTRVAGLTLGAVVIGSGVKNFIESYSNKTFNSVGMVGPNPSPEGTVIKNNKKIIDIWSRK